MFKLKENNIRIRSEILAGVTTFITLAYVLVATPSMITNAVDPGNAALNASLYIATCLSAFCGTLLMGLLANLPVASAPGMGLNAFFACTLLGKMGYTYPEALAITFFAGLIFLAATLLGLRRAIESAIPKNMRVAICAGLGLYAVMLGLQQAGIITASGSSVSFIDIRGLFISGDYEVLFSAGVALAGVAFITLMKRMRMPAVLVLGLILTGGLYYGVGIPLGLVEWNGFSFSIADVGSDFGDWLGNSFAKGFTEGIVSLFDSGKFINNLYVTFMVTISFTFVQVFQSAGVTMGLRQHIEVLDEEENRNADNNEEASSDEPKKEINVTRRAMLADSISTMFASFIGTSPVSSCTESTSGISVGGRSGLSSVITAVLFLAAVFVSPVVELFRPAIAAALLIFIGMYMLRVIKSINMKDVTEATPALVTLAFMPFVGIVEALSLGLLMHFLVKVICLRFKDITAAEIVLLGFAAIRYIFVFV